MTTTVDANALVRAVREVARWHPDRKATARYRYDNGEPCCIIAHAWDELALDPALLVEGRSAMSLIPGVTDDAAWRWLAEVQDGQDSGLQDGQDSGLRWQAAVDKADDMIAA